ncbi:PREDICTED: fasciclin-like arabinogalactan protein 1 [Camelina sativa]|uniref:Fasciclin-like arabinogalactan protein 1 n=1 Tax=Camelina sativa TaxID=90675 RepID=A0ABM0Y8D1_CAMSA|nr:PREDICTED: fasciclin-like arabinogalactan protein 1 [Camelina sativa]
MAKKMSSIIIFNILLLLTTQTHAHNVTRLLANHPSFSSFSHYLTQTHLADEINRRTTITVCAVDNAAMAALTSKGYTISTLKNILSLHVLLDYFGTKKLHQIRDGSALAATMFQATGAAPGTTGFVNITDLRGGKVGFGPDGGDLSSFFVKSIEEVPYNISIIQISRVLPSETAAAPTPAPAEMNLLTVQNDGEKVTLKTRINTVKIVDTLIDEQPLAIYATDKVLLPKELFKASAVEAPAPAPAPEDGDVADSPKPAKGKGKGKKKKAAPSPDESAFGDSDSPAEGPDGEADDATADDAGAVRIIGGAKAGLMVSLLCLFASSWLL